MDEYKMIRFELWPENEIVILEAIKRIQKDSGIQISPQRLINMLIPALESTEFQAEVVIKLKIQPSQITNDPKNKPSNPIIRRRSNWMTRI